jgi:hypothetical protein
MAHYPLLIETSDPQDYKELIASGLKRLLSFWPRNPIL